MVCGDEIKLPDSTAEDDKAGNTPVAVLGDVQSQDFCNSGPGWGRESHLHAAL